MGAHYISDSAGTVGTEQDRSLSNIIIHKKYNGKSVTHDIALLQLKEPVSLGRGVGIVCLSNPSNVLPIDDENKKCVITGWGTLKSGGKQPDKLQEASVPLVSKSRCLKGYPGEIDDSMLCAGLDQGGVDACQGDSGGPLVCEFNGRWFVEGATSWGNGCAKPGYYGIYANVDYLRSWVLSHTGSLPLPSGSPPTGHPSRPPTDRPTTGSGKIFK